MRELVYYVHVSLDGCIAAPDGAFDAFPIEGDHAAVLTGEFGDALPSAGLAALGIAPPRTRFDTVIMGWSTYAVGLPEGMVSPYAHLRQFVASRRDRDLPPEVERTDDALATVRALKAEDGLGIYLCGGGDLAGQLFDEIDRLVLKRSPLAFGSGIRLFGEQAYRPIPFELERARTFASGESIEEYRRV